MPKVVTVSFAEDRVIFIDPKTSKSEELLFESPAEDNEAIKGLRNEVKARGSVTRYALSVLVQILNNQRIDGYKGQVPQNQRIPAEAKSALRELEDDFLRPKFLENLPKSMSTSAQHKEWDSFIKELREPGVYARVRGVCLKYFCYLGMLPCVYGSDQKPDTHKLLAVSAMEKILANENAKSPPMQPDHSIPSELGALMARMIEEKDKLDVAALQIIQGRLSMFQEEVKQLINLADKTATEAREAGAVQAAAPLPAPKSEDQQLNIPEPGQTATPRKGSKHREVQHA